MTHFIHLSFTFYKNILFNNLHRSKSSKLLISFVILTYSFHIVIKHYYDPWITLDWFLCTFFNYLILSINHCSDLKGSNGAMEEKQFIFTCIIPLLQSSFTIFRFKMLLVGDLYIIQYFFCKACILLTKGGQISDIYIFRSICNLLCILRTSNFLICFTLEKYGYSENQISEHM